MKFRALTEDDCAAAAGLHATSFDAPWSADSLRESLTAQGGFGVAAIEEVGADVPQRASAWSDSPMLDSDQAVEPLRGFILLRASADEGEILTLAIAPSHRRLGIAMALVTQARAMAGDLGLAVLFLEVAETNSAARALYDRAGFREIGMRPHYYGKISAVMMRCRID